ncbi:hypothetical protein J2Y41_004483 [Arthrobacter sp. 1088]|uniref:hypothetical protein n=1 Tax=Arthrobacter sp. 1088 TaxID=2817768 RepID=UPI0028596D00|nr:hypothetical protein [Arthrobacter sp. 1088]MDR6688885.1 hypothetical protein [Arthrobacter sp. 1088]
MDQIKSQISSIDPLAHEPEAEINGEEALARMLTGPRVFSDTVPAGVSSLQERRNRKVRIAGALLLGAAAVTAGVLVAANFGSISSTPAPAVTVTTPEPTPTPTPSVSATPSPIATPTATPTPEASQAPTPTAPAATTTAPVAPPVQVPTIQTFTFPDGHVSFRYPAGWTVRPEQGPSDGATVLDSTGAEVAFMSSGFYGDGTAGLVDRTVLDRAVVPGVTDTAGNQVEFGFSLNYIMNIDYNSGSGGMPTASGRSDSPPVYVMDIRLSSELQSGQTSSGTNQIRMPNGFMIAYVKFDLDKQPTFATPEAAKAWMGSEQYSQLKAMLLSVSYN